MEPREIKDINFRGDLTRLLKNLHIKEGSDDAEEVKRLLTEAERTARPKALYGEAGIESRGDDWVVIDGVKFSSRILKVNLDGVHRVFPYVATCGAELEGWALGMGDMLARYWADGIMLMALGEAVAEAERRIEEDFHPGKTGRMNPGSLADWPISEQRPLFQLAGGPEERIGVRLTESFLMIPAKSVSGIRFPTEVTYENCQLCPREVCPGRRAPYDRDLYNRKYAQKA